MAKRKAARPRYKVKCSAWFDGSTVAVVFIGPGGSLEELRKLLADNPQLETKGRRRGK